MQLTLSQALKRRKLTAKALAERVGVNKSTITRMKHGYVRPLHDTVVKVERALGLEPGTLKLPKVA